MVGVKEKDLFEDIIGDSVVEAESNSIINIKFLCTRSDVDSLRRTHYVSFFLPRNSDMLMRFPVDEAPLSVQLRWVVVKGDFATQIRSEDVMSFSFLLRVKLVIHICCLLFASVLFNKDVTSPMFLMRGERCFSLLMYHVVYCINFLCITS